MTDLLTRRRAMLARTNQPKDVYRIYAPPAWKPEDESLNIVDIFRASTIPNKRYIFTITDTATSVGNGIYYLYGGTRLYETVNGEVIETDFARGTNITLTPGSTNRYAIVSGSGLVQRGGVLLSADIVWCHLGEGVPIIYPQVNSYPSLITSEEESLDVINPNLKFGNAGILDLPSIMYYLGYSFNATGVLAIVIRATNPPIGNTTAGSYSNINCDIFVPDDSVDAYKAAIRFSNWANKIKPLSLYDRNDFITP